MFHWLLLLLSKFYKIVLIWEVYRLPSFFFVSSWIGWRPLFFINTTCTCKWFTGLWCATRNCLICCKWLSRPHDMKKVRRRVRFHLVIVPFFVSTSHMRRRWYFDRNVDSNCRSFLVVVVVDEFAFLTKAPCWSSRPSAWQKASRGGDCYARC